MGVFGADPLGVPTPIAATALIALAVAPLGLMAWHLVSMNYHIAAAGGKPGRGVFGILVALNRNWEQPFVRHHALGLLTSLLVFFARVALWIVATSRVGV